MGNNVNNSKEYDEIRKQAETWPNWQKEYYNNVFATSKNAKKLSLTKNCKENSLHIDDDTLHDIDTIFKILYKYNKEINFSAILELIKLK